jgi:hypothetical protein
MRLAGFAFASIFAGSVLGQTPTIGGLLNNYSYTLLGLPNYGIAQGSIFVIFGSNFSSTQTPLQSPPPAALNGVTIDVTVGDTTTHPLFYYLYPTQIAAVLPSATPVGAGMITVTTSAGTSRSRPAGTFTKRNSIVARWCERDSPVIAWMAWRRFPQPRILGG